VAHRDLLDRRPLAGIMIMSRPEAGGPKEQEKTHNFSEIAPRFAMG
jgi:hypothetical protein